MLEDRRWGNDKNERVGGSRSLSLRRTGTSGTGSSCTRSTSSRRSLALRAGIRLWLLLAEPPTEKHDRGNNLQRLALRHSQPEQLGMSKYAPNNRMGQYQSH